MIVDDIILGPPVNVPSAQVTGLPLRKNLRRAAAMS